jgi:DNA polymerase-3 subunit delta
LDDLRRLVRDAWPDAELYEFEANSLDTVELMQLLSPSLFGAQRLVVLRNAQDLPAASVASVVGLLSDVDADTYVVVQHLGAAKGKAVLDAIRKTKPTELTFGKITRAEDRQAFVREEVRRLKGKITPEGAAAVLEAVGTDLREIAATIAQLLGDNGGLVDADAVAAYHRGRAEVTGFVVAEQAVTGNVTAALTNLRWALNIGVAPVLIADALADGVRSVARVMAAGPGDPFKLAPVLGMAPWKVKKSRGQAQGWTESGLQQALAVVATLNGQVKGTAADPHYALEAAVRKVVAARSPRR